MAVLAKKYEITHPLTAEQAAHIDELFRDIYRQLRTSPLGSGVLAAANGGTGSAFVTFLGPTAPRNYTLPDANAIILTDAALITVPQGGTGLNTFTAYALLCGGTAATTPLQNVSGVGTAGQILTSNGAAALPTWQPAPSSGAGAMTLLKAGSGTTTNVAQENVDTVSITGLSALDMIHIDLSIESETATTASPSIRNDTDSLNIVTPTDAPLPAGGKFESIINIGQRQNGATSVSGHAVYTKTTASGVTGSRNDATFTTNWTGTWTLALKHGGVTAGGTLRWKWRVYKVVGQ